jgi:hypothetical protein
MDIEQLLRRQADMEKIRNPYEAHWDAIQRRIFPYGAEFQRTTVPGDTRTQDRLDSTAMLALDRYAAALIAMIAPRTERWHQLATTDAALNRRPRVRAYFEAVSEQLFTARYGARASFARRFERFVKGAAAYGTAGLFVDQLPGVGRIYRAIPTPQIYLATDPFDRATIVHRKWRWPARKVLAQWGERVPGDVRALAETQPEAEVEVLHAIFPRADHDEGAPGPRGMALRSLTVLPASKAVIADGGYYTLPLLVHRAGGDADDTYGTSIAMQVLPEIKLANEMAKTIMKAAHKAVDPALLVADDGVLTKLNTAPGKVNVGGISARGEMLVQPLQTGGNLPIGFEAQEQNRRVINDAFLITLFQVLVEQPDRQTATEVLERLREKGVLLAPAGGALEEELLAPMVEREIDLDARAGLLPPMPPELAEANGEYRITFDNPLNRAARAGQAVGLLRTFEQLTPLAAADPAVATEIGRRVDWGTVIPALFDINGVPPSWLKPPEQLAEEQAAQAQAAEAAALLQAAPAASAAAANIAKAAEAEGIAVV